MNETGLPSILVARQELEDFWHHKLDAARKRFESAKTRDKAEIEGQEDQLQRPDGSPVLERREVTVARAEYHRLLNIFTGLVVDRRMPPELGTSENKRELSATETLVSVVDDNESVRDSTKFLLRSAGYKVTTFETGELFLNSDACAQTDCLVLDIAMPGMDGLEVQRRLSDSGVDLPVIFVTARNDDKSRQRAIDGGAFDFFQKPFTPSAFLDAVRTAVESSRVL